MLNFNNVNISLITLPVNIKCSKNISSVPQKCSTCPEKNHIFVNSITRQTAFHDIFYWTLNFWTPDIDVKRVGINWGRGKRGLAPLLEPRASRGVDPALCVCVNDEKVGRDK